MSKIKRLENGHVLWESTPRRERTGGHVIVIGGNYSASDEEVLAFVVEKNPGFDGWWIQEYAAKDDKYFWMVCR